MAQYSAKGHQYHGRRGRQLNLADNQDYSRDNGGLKNGRVGYVQIAFLFLGIGRWMLMMAPIVLEHGVAEVVVEVAIDAVHVIGPVLSVVVLD